MFGRKPFPKRISLAFIILLILYLFQYNLKIGSVFLKPKDPRHRTELNTVKRCSNTPVKLLILVSSNVGNYDRREHIRLTWGTDHLASPRWQTWFLLGKNGNEAEMQFLDKEESLYGDLIRSDYRENFRNMSYKVAMGFEWATKYCPFDFLLKVDDDVFVNPYRLVELLKAKAIPRNKLFMGNPMVYSPVLREGRYAVSVKELNKTYFHPYCSGGGILMSSDVVAMFFDLYDIETPLSIDDAYLGELAKKAGFNVTASDDFRMYEDKCKFRPQTIVQHPAKGSCFNKLYQELLNHHVPR